jgi:hypothetical protein
MWLKKGKQQTDEFNKIKKLCRNECEGGEMDGSGGFIQPRKRYGGRINNDFLNSKEISHGNQN